MLADYEEAAKNGRSDAHAELGSIYCGKLCLVPKSDATEAGREFLRRRAQELEKFGVEPDYVKAYMHFKLAEIPAKLDFNFYLKELAAHMTDKELKQAEQLAEEWKQHYYHEWDKL